MDLSEELAAIDQQTEGSETKNNTIDNVFLYGMLGLFVLLGIWVVYTMVSNNSSPITVSSPALGTTLPMLDSLKDPQYLIPAALPRINQIPSDP